MNQEARNKLVESYFSSISGKFQTGQAREHAYRPDFESLIKSLDPSLKVINDPSRSEHGNPDFVFLRGDVTVGYVETKDIGVDLNKTEKTNQMERYLGYSNLILTDYLEFRFFKNGLKRGENIRIGNITGSKLSAEPQNFSELADALADFLKGEPEPIKSGKRLAEIMGGKARRIRDNIKHFLSSESGKNAELTKVYETIKKLLVHDLTLETFADMYAQTLVYGLFVARYHDETEKDFSRQEARELIPASNPFLRHFFDHIVGPNFDKRLEYIVDELCEVFSHANVQELVHQYFKKNDLWGNTQEGADPVIHFYEDFLKEYDAELRKRIGAYYTPLPIVRFIIKSIDELLKKEFGLSKGLADDSKIDTVQGKVHRVQILDPAVGTGTFIAEVIHKIHSYFTGQEGRWASFVHHDLLPRLHGFELMMASYTIAHLKMSMILKETGFKYFNNTRLGIYLTNSLEESNKQDNLLSSFGLAESISEESKAASDIKNNKPIMIVVGNPPYSGESSNNFESANRLIDKYKFEPGGVEKLKERNPKWLNDDYVKFIAFAENLVEKNGEGILGYITNHAYLDNPTFRGMRWKLANTFDDIYIIDLHGNAKKKEVSPDGTKDENVFNIMQGVAIIIGVKKENSKKETANVYHADIYGKRDQKFLSLGDVIDYKKIVLDPKYYFFIPKKIEGKDNYDKGFSLQDLFIESSVGIVTGRDGIAISESVESLKSNVIKYINKPEFNFDEEKVKEISYRPFDTRYIYYDKEVVGRGRWDLMRHFLTIENFGLIFKRGGVEEKSAPIFTSKYISESRSWSRPGMQGIEFIAPLYLLADDKSRVSNLKKEIIGEIEVIVGNTTPEDIFDYIYAVLHSPSYREKYKEFLKIDFPRVSYPKDKKQFKELSALGRELRGIHLFESPKLNQSITSYSVVGSDIVEKILYKDGKVFINSEQYFGNIPEIAWNFYIGGYQPAQKWLKDRKDRTLTSEEISHYQKIIVALVETDSVIKEIDKFI